MVRQGSIRGLLRTAGLRSVLFDHRDATASERACADIMQRGLPGVRAASAGDGRIRVAGQPAPSP
ncbi:hypothetical protein GKJPGBOP_07997 [Streptomyces paromomycinus]|uniref:Uncharacterized protein n=1 Tax=Streptomyces paromomycinus TaxID=92743 RepID=A0A401WFW2_STREY|nr:hypothetical protein GKJPGBOP_07997 [Streptomyces paromomycinus]